ncbi:MAG: DNA cytosine methyltransferase [Coleofasciculaceae cyanobacterium]
MQSIELFAGAGGLALGVARAGFRHNCLIESDKNACITLRENQNHLFGETSQYPVIQCDISKVDFTIINEQIDFLTGGPPCQPFSVGGKHRGYLDQRDMFPQFLRAIRELKPRVILIENVKGLLRKSFTEYFEYIILQLTYPEIIIKSDETWINHLSRLKQHHIKGFYKNLSYHVLFRLLNAADYGIPQQRHRIFIVCIRSDLNLEWSFPKPTHSQEALLWTQWVTKNYWAKHKILQSGVPKKLISQVQQLESSLFPPDQLPWQTVRDALQDLPEPIHAESTNIANHRFVDGAKAYPGHTGSLLDEPAKTLKAGVHGVPGGENMVICSNGSVRYFTVREAARLQTFPDEYLFSGSWTKAMHQLGNAVPVTLAEILASSIQNHLRIVKH